MKKEELDKIIASHDRWLCKKDGKCADLSKKDLCGVNLSGANLSKANLDGANLGGANLGNAILSEANLVYANLKEADLHGVDLYGADLHGANLHGANLYGAILCKANLRGANLEGANLVRADLWVAYLPTGMYHVVGAGSCNRCTTYNTINDQIICGCWDDGAGNHLNSFIKRIEEVYGINGESPNQIYYAEYMSAISFFKAVNELNKKS